jgi:hypothetical protein
LASRSETPDVHREWTTETFEHIERNAGPFFDQPQILDADTGLMVLLDLGPLIRQRLVTNAPNRAAPARG